MIRTLGCFIALFAMLATLESEAQVGGKGKKGGGGFDKKPFDPSGGGKGGAGGKGKGGTGGEVTKGEAGTFIGYVTQLSPNHIILTTEPRQIGKGGIGDGKGGKADAKGGKGKDAGGAAGMGGDAGKGAAAKGGKGGMGEGGKGGDNKSGTAKGKSGGEHALFFFTPMTRFLDAAGTPAAARNLVPGTQVQVQYQNFHSASGNSARIALEIKLIGAP